MKVNRLNLRPRAKRQTDEDNRFYQSKVWRSLRNEYIKQNPLCVYCQSNGIIKEAKVVDHIIPILMGGNSLSVTNLQSLCDSCHARKSAKEKR